MARLPLGRWHVRGTARPIPSAPRTCLGCLGLGGALGVWTFPSLWECGGTCFPQPRQLASGNKPRFRYQPLGNGSWANGRIVYWKGPLILCRLHRQGTLQRGRGAEAASAPGKFTSDILTFLGAVLYSRADEWFPRGSTS